MEEGDDEDDGGGGGGRHKKFQSNLTLELRPSSPYQVPHPSIQKLDKVVPLTRQIVLRRSPISGPKVGSELKITCNLKFLIDQKTFDRSKKIIWCSELPGSHKFYKNKK